tara:strand:+ start:1360 stop:2949 length:1590 start_codon:yes stop_codon:yes gene_type:complete
MANKLTKDKLDLLIEQVLNEKTLQDLPLSVDTGATATKIRRSLGVGTRGDKKDWVDLIGIAGSPTELEYQDLKKAIEDNPTKWREYIGWLAKSKMLTGDTKRLIKVIESPPIDLKDLELDLDADAKKALKQINAEFKKYKVRKGQQGLGTVELPYRSLSVNKDWTDGDNLNFKSVPQATISVFRKGLQDSGGDFQEYFANLAKFGEALAQISGKGKTNKTTQFFKNQNEAKNYLKSMPPEEIINTGTILKTLGVLAKEVQGASAGTIFETFLALMLGGGILGGLGKATDVIAGKRGKRKFSAKNYQGEPSGTQSPENFKQELGTDRNEIIWYICMVKTGDKGDGSTVTNFTRLDIYITGVSWNGQDKENHEDYICYTADSPPKPFAHLKKYAKGWAIAWDQKPNFMIPIAPSWADKSSIASFDKMFVDTVEKLSVEVLTAIKDMNAMLKDLNDQTKIYIADKSPESAEAIGTNYSGLKKKITGGIGKIGDSGEQSTFKKKSGIKENQTKSLKDLDKLIERVIIESMNKK